MTTHSIYTITSRPSPPKPSPGPSSSSLGEPPLVVPGELIASSKYWMRGHGTFLDDQPDTLDEHDEGDEEDVQMDAGAKIADGLIRSTLAGSVERINKLVSVRGLRGRYRPEVGDLVIGRITEVQSKRWKVEAGARQHAVLMLGSVNLPGGVQRRKLESDELQMRYFFQEGDLLVAEVQAFFGDGAMSLHTRSLKYGKLRNGMLVKVPSQLIMRLKSHFHMLPFGVELIIGVNGWIWIAQQRQQLPPDGSCKEGFEATTEDMYSDTNDPISSKTRAKIARVAGAINLLASNSMPISDLTVLRAYEASLEICKLEQPMDIDSDPGHGKDTEGRDGVVGFLRNEFREQVVAILAAN